MTKKASASPAHDEGAESSEDFDIDVEIGTIERPSRTKEGEKASFGRTSSGRFDANRISFEELSADLDEAFGEALGYAGDGKSKESSEGDPAYAGFSGSQLRYLESQEMSALDQLIAEVTEPSGLFPLPGQVVPSLRDIELPEFHEEILPVGPSSFEDSGLFEIFVDEDFDIDVVEAEQLSPAVQAHQLYVNHLERVLERLFDSLELALIDRSYGEFKDIHKQLNRVARLLGFVDLGYHLPLIAHLQHLLPLASLPWPNVALDQAPRYELKASSLAYLAAHIDDFLNGLLYLISELVKEISGLNRDRYQRRFLELYSRLGVEPGEPSERIPLGPKPTDPLQQTSRTKQRLVRGFFNQLKLVLNYLESAVRGGLVRGYDEAIGACTDLGRVVEDYLVAGVMHPLLQLTRYLEGVRTQGPLGKRLVTDLQKVCDAVTAVLPDFDGAVLIDRAEELIHQLDFSQRASTGKLVAPGSSPAAGDFAVAWPAFREQADKALRALLHVNQDSDSEEVLTTVRGIKAVARAQGITLLERLLGTLEEYWNRTPAACSMVLEELSASICALPVRGTQYVQLEALARSIVDELVQRRNHEELATPAPVGNEISAFLVRLVAQIEGLLRLTMNCVEQEDFAALPKLRSSSAELAAQARSQGIHSLGLACEVIAELSSSHHEDLFDLLLETHTILESVLNATIDRIDEIENGSLAQLTVDAFLDRWVNLDATGQRTNLAFAKTLTQVIESTLAATDRWWDQFLSQQSARASEVGQYQQELDKLVLTVKYWMQRSLQIEIEHHRARFSEAFSKPEKLLEQHPTYLAIKEMLVGSLPELHPYTVNPRDVRFGAKLLKWVQSIIEALDHERTRLVSSSQSAWMSLAKRARQDLGQEVRHLSCVPFLALFCELRDIVMSGLARPNKDIYLRVELLHYWTHRLFYVLAPEAGEAPEEAAPQWSPRRLLTLQQSSELTRTLAALQGYAKSLSALQRVNPGAQAEAEMKALIAPMLEGFVELEGLVSELFPEQLGERLAAIEEELNRRAQVIDEKLRVEVVIDHDARSFAQHHYGENTELVEASLAIAYELICILFNQPSAPEHQLIQLEVKATENDFGCALLHYGGKISHKSIAALLSTGATELDGAELIVAAIADPAVLEALSCINVLKLTHAFVSRHEGKASIDDLEDGGSCLSFSLPTHRSLP